MVRLSGHGSVKRIVDGIVVHLDDILALDQIVTGATRYVERCRRRTPRRGREGQRHQGQEGSETHVGSFGRLRAKDADGGKGLPECVLLEQNSNILDDIATIYFQEKLKFAKLFFLVRYCGILSSN